MKKMFAALMVSFIFVMPVVSCKKKETAPPPPTPAVPQAQMGAPAQPPQALPPGHQAMAPRGETTVVVPDSVKGSWKGVVIVVENKESKKSEEFKVDLGSDFKVPNTAVKISVGEFLPDFKMDGLTITSSSNEAKNPAVRIKIFENDKEVFKGWLYSKFPEIHPFEHPKIGLKLKEGLKKG